MARDWTLENPFCRLKAQLSVEQLCQLSTFLRTPFTAVAQTGFKGRKNLLLTAAEEL
ncbi:UNVERIFIED_CONTAM: hypothetical protein Sradi_1969900 [Sesamum radiatum]|uniref:Uncharacterized protein n=1 Tax=Sesamum radiatum TaxID=300843 RepID=A0AAW2TID9_SESRA